MKINHQCASWKYTKSGSEIVIIGHQPSSVVLNLLNFFQIYGWFYATLCKTQYRPRTFTPLFQMFSMYIRIVLSESKILKTQGWDPISIEIVTGLGSLSISAPLTDRKEFKLHTVHSGTWVQTRPLQLVGWEEEFKFESKLKPLLVIWPAIPKAVPEGNLNSAKLLGHQSKSAFC